MLKKDVIQSLMFGSQPHVCFLERGGDDLQLERCNQKNLMRKGDFDVVEIFDEILV